MAHLDPPKRIQWTAELVTRFWNQVSKTRLNEYSFAKQAGKSLVIAIKHLLRPSDKILDFGAGDGDLIKFLCECGYMTTGYEPSIDRQKNLQELHDNPPSFNGFVDFSSREIFDVVIMAEVIEHILDSELENTLGRLAAFTKVNGYLIVTTPNEEDLELGMSYCPISNTLFHRWQHVRSFNAMTLASMLDKYGFEEIVTHEIEFNNSLFVPGDDIWGGRKEKIPSYVKQIRENKKTKVAGEKNLLYVGIKRR
jgi:2-polyprenyl-3-methyl-5-hydroxy-6-metoxy-1,4-benzoquinol methylase